MDNDDFRVRVQARVIQAGYSERDAERVVLAEVLAENERLRVENTHLAGLKTVMELKRLRAENAELRSDNDVLKQAQRITYAARDELDWFRRYYGAIRAGEDMIAWERANPKTGADA